MELTEEILRLAAIVAGKTQLYRLDVAGGTAVAFDVPVRLIDFKPGDRSRDTAAQRSISMVDALQKGMPLPPIRVIKKGSGFQIYDGNARLTAYQEVGKKTIPVVIVQDRGIDMDSLPSVEKSEYFKKMRKAGLVALDCDKFEADYVTLLKQFHQSTGRAKQMLRKTIREMKKRLDKECEQEQEGDDTFIVNRRYDPDYFSGQGGIVFSILRDGTILHMKMSIMHEMLKDVHADEVYEEMKQKRYEKEFRKHGVKKLKEWELKVGKRAADAFVKALDEEHDRNMDKLFDGVINGRAGPTTKGELVVSFWLDSMSKSKKKSLAGKLPFRWDKIAIWSK